ncbi:unnamed protein product [Ilex paraguariensis]|uniref:Uncharacterized protein n=1 Tax=Ilex paraguariensis TaxID=185542 RepID=A0ABC8TIA1_9AQUA
MSKYRAMSGSIISINGVKETLASQGLLVDGGGDRKGMEGNVVGMEGIEGMVGREVAGSGGSDTFGMAGMVGSEGIWVAGRGGNVGFGKVGAVGIVGIAVNGGSEGLGRDGIGSLTLALYLKQPKMGSHHKNLRADSTSYDLRIVPLGK